MTLLGLGPNESQLDTCPCDASLNDFVGLLLSEADTSGIRRHVVSCVHCQRRLESLSDSESRLAPLGHNEIDWDIPAIERIVRGLCQEMSLDDSESTNRDRTIVFEKPPDAVSIGKLNGYTIRRELASGATATVFEAIDTKTDLPCAIKFIRSASLPRQR